MPRKAFTSMLVERVSTGNAQLLLNLYILMAQRDFRSTWACACVAVTAVRPETPSTPFAFSFVELMGKVASSTRSSKTKAQIVLTSLISVPHKTILGLLVGPIKTLWYVKFSRDTQGAMGWPYTRSRYYHIYLNGVYWGIFQTQERVGPNFCSDYLGGDPEDYDVLKQGDNRDMFASSGSLDDYYKFWEQANAGFATDAAYYKAQGLQPDGVTPNPDFRKYLDPDNLIDYMIITYWTADRDGPGSKYTRPRPNNYYCFFNRNNPDGFKFMEHDSEHSLGANVEDMVNPL